MNELNFSPDMVRMIKGRLRLLEPSNQPFFGQLAMKLDLVPDKATKTMATNGLVIKYNPEYIATLPNRVLDTMIAHEVMHPLLGHHARRNGRNVLLWNIATDFAINLILVKAGMRLWEGALYDERFEGMTAERIYALLLAQTPEPDPQPGKPGKGGNGQPGQPGQPSDEPGEPGQPGEPGEQPGPGSQPADEAEEDTEAPTPTQNGQDEGKDQPEPIDWKTLPEQPGEVEDLPPGKDSQTTEATEAEKAESARDWAVAGEQAARLSQGHGNMGADVERSVREMKRPVVDWVAALERFVKQLVPTDTTWDRPNKRYVSSGLYLPSVVKKGMGELVIFVDTSGSIDQRTLDAFATEISTILTEVSPERVYIVYVDTMVRATQEFEGGQPIRPSQLTPRGGGGTSFRPGFVWVENHRIEPAAAIYLTDMDATAFPVREPDYPVLWVSTDRYKLTAPFGEVIYAEI